MNLNDLLTAEKIDPKQVIVFRHVPPEPELRKVLPWFAAERPHIFNAYQQTQGPKVEKAMLRARYVASFIGHKSRQALFVGLYSIGESTPLTVEDFWAKPEYIEMKKYGMKGFDWSDGRSSVLWFDLEKLTFCEQWKGKLVVNWPPPGISWWRLAHNTDQITVHAILEDSALEADTGRWDQLALKWDHLLILPRGLRSKLGEWRGIYYIFDTLASKGYVGSAYGTENLLGRWHEYADSGHGGNELLKGRDPRNFVFSILELLPHDAQADAVIEKENGWKQRLSTRSHGFTKN